MSALRSVADICSAPANVRFTLKADIPSGERLALNGHYNSWGYIAAPVAIVLRQ